MSLTANLLVFSLLFAVSFAHLCLISPPQRGSMMNLNTAATADCFLTTGPCGGRSPQPPNVMLIAGTNFTVTWQKNENHWTTANPGSFNVSYADVLFPDTWIQLETFTDTNSPALTLYEYILDVSHIKPSKITLQVAYIAPALPATFYQCADVVVMH